MPAFPESNVYYFYSCLRNKHGGYSLILSILKRFTPTLAAMPNFLSNVINCHQSDSHHAALQSKSASLWGRLKVGRLYGKSFATRREAMNAVIDWLNFCNHKRLHSTLGSAADFANSFRHFQAYRLPYL